MNFRFTTAGESHGKALIALVEGVPAGLKIDKEMIDRERARRQLGYGRGGRMKIEQDEVQIISGVRHGKAIGSPISRSQHWFSTGTASHASFPKS